MMQNATSLLQRAICSPASRSWVRACNVASEQPLQGIRAFAASPEPEASKDVAAEPQVLKFGVNGEGRETITTVTTITGTHSLRLDEPKFLGGKDTAANPAEYLLSSLVGCIQVTLHVIAGEAGVKLSKVEWHADGDIDLRGFLGVPGVFPGFQRIDVTARITADASAEQLEALRQKVLVRCPVGNTIKAPGVLYKLRFLKV